MRAYLFSLMVVGCLFVASGSAGALEPDEYELSDTDLKTVDALFVALVKAHRLTNLWLRSLSSKPGVLGQAYSRISAAEAIGQLRTALVMRIGNDQGVGMAFRSEHTQLVHATANLSPPPKIKAGRNGRTRAYALSLANLRNSATPICLYPTEWTRTFNAYFHPNKLVGYAYSSAESLSVSWRPLFPGAATGPARKSAQPAAFDLYLTGSSKAGGHTLRIRSRESWGPASRIANWSQVKALQGFVRAQEHGLLPPHNFH